MANNQQITVLGSSILVKQISGEDYISLTDMVSGFNDGSSLIDNWLRNKNTIEFIGMWELMKNPSFNSLEFEGIRNEAGANRFTLSVTQWVTKTGAIGLTAKTGRYGGTFAHKDIAFEFGSWLSPQFKLFLLTEFQRLKELESNQYNLEWNVKRILTKVNHRIHTDSIKDPIVPTRGLPKDKEWIIYADEVDLLNVALFGCTAKEWRDHNPAESLKGNNLRDNASINELTVLSNMESINAMMIKQGIEKKDRFANLIEMATSQLKVLNEIDIIKSIKYESIQTYPTALEEKKKVIELQEKESDVINADGVLTTEKFNNGLKKMLNTKPPKPR